MLRNVLLLMFAIASPNAVHAGVVRVADGDCNGLSSAVANAGNTAGTTTVLLARAGTYSACALDTRGDVLIDGQGATFKFLTARVGGTSLTIRNASISALQNQASMTPVCTVSANDLGAFAGSSEGAICNYGATLVLDSVSVHDLDISAPFLNTGWPYLVQLDGLIYSSGTLVLRNVTFANNRGVYAFVVNSGALELDNVTVANNDSHPFFHSQVIPGLSPRITVSNSLFASNSAPVCSNPGDPVAVASSGGNVATDASCGLSTGTGDKIVADANLGTFGDHGGLIPTQAISGGSPAHGAGVARYCEALDARGYTRSPHGCDAGAYEYGGGSGALTANGLNGFYYDPDANGHYVSLQRIHDNGDIAIVWSTFDSKGNQAWVYGVGQLSGRRIHADMSQNLGGVLQPGGAPTGSSVHPWGTVDIDLTSCALAQFSYQSAIDGFGNGQFPLTRLAFVSDFGCSD